MEVPNNEFRQRVSAVEASFGIWNTLPSPLVMEILAGAGFDWVMVDAEHGPFELSSIISQFQAVTAYGVPALVRPPSGDPVFIKRLLDAGVQSFLVPMVDSAAEAAQLVRAMRYPPAGNRGIGAAMGRATQWNRVENYLERADRELCLIVQVETEAAYRELEAILSVDGVDGVVFGPSDLSASMGLVGQVEHPAVVKRIEEGLSRTRRAGKIAGTFSLSVEVAKRYVQCGANMIGVGVDSLLLAGAARQLIRQFR